ncbi:MAG: hypothetical protein RR415_06735 [Ruthenibacterium sp.]
MQTFLFILSSIFLIVSPVILVLLGIALNKAISSPRAETEDKYNEKMLEYAKVSVRKTRSPEEQSAVMEKRKAYYASTLPLFKEDLGITKIIAVKSDLPVFSANWYVKEAADLKGTFVRLSTEQAQKENATLLVIGAKDNQKTTVPDISKIPKLCTLTGVNAFQADNEQCDEFADILTNLIDAADAQAKNIPLTILFDVDLLSYIPRFTDCLKRMREKNIMFQIVVADDSNLVAQIGDEALRELKQSCEYEMTIELPDAPMKSMIAFDLDEYQPTAKK